MKILYSYRTEDERRAASQNLSEHEVQYHDGSLQVGDWNGEGVEALCIFVDSNVGALELSKLPDLKFIATKSTGFDHIDLDLTKEKGVMVSNVPAYGEHTVAEFAFALILTLARNVIEAHEKVMKGAFNAEGLSGFDLCGKTLGILGTGKIGKNVAKIGRGFDMNIIAFDKFPDENFAASNGVKYVSFDDVISQADIISLHLPENDETHNIINKDKISQMKKGVTLINTARGSLIDTEALIWGLEQGIISGAGIDVLSEEGNVDDEMRLLSRPHPNEENMKTLLMNHYLIDHPSVIITPHTAFNTAEAVGRILETSLENIQHFTQGQPQNLVV
jgi:D-lactate dehydrogenase